MSASILAPPLTGSELLETTHNAFFVIDDDTVSVGGHAHLACVHLVRTCNREHVAVSCVRILPTAFRYR